MTTHSSNIIPLRPHAWSATTHVRPAAGVLAAQRLRGDFLGLDGNLARVLGPLPLPAEDDAGHREELTRFRDLFERAPVGVLVMDFDGSILRANAMAAALLQRDAHTLRQTSLFDLCDPGSRPRLRDHLGQLATGMDLDICELELVGADRSVLSMQAATLNVRDAPEGPLRMALIDVSGLDEEDAGLNLAANVVEHTALGIVVTDAQRRIIAVNPAYTSITGFSAQEMLGRTPDFFNAADAVTGPLATQGPDADVRWQGEVWGHRKTGDAYPQWISVSAITDETGTPTHYVCTLADMTGQEDAKQELRELAYTDALTGLANRTSLLDQLSRSLVAARRHKQLVGLLFLDLDRFKEVNDSLGHAVGDRLLQFFAAQLQASVRQSDLVARLGGDEFVILLPDLKRIQAAGQVAAKILRRLSENPFVEDGHRRHLDASIGIALFPKDAPSSDGLLACADAAMYAAKRGGRRGYRYYAAGTDAHHRAGDALESDLRGALERREFELLYQPQVCLQSFRVVGCEAVLRWNHPEQGSIAPERFLPLAERTGIMVPLRQWALRKAAARARYWNRHTRGVRVNMDLSPMELENTQMEHLRAFLADPACVFPDGLEFEIAASGLSENREPYLRVAKQLGDLGIGMALNDFGSGPIALAAMKRLPLTRVKLAPALIGALETDPDAPAIVEALITLGHQFGLKVLAQGVETPGQIAFLKAHRCDEAQGNLLSQALGGHRFTDLLKRAAQSAAGKSEQASAAPLPGLLGTMTRAGRRLLARIRQTLV